MFAVTPESVLSSMKSFLAHSHVVKQCHKSEVHVKLLMTVKECEPGIIGNEVDLRLLIPSEHHHVFVNSCCALSGDFREFEAVPVKMDGMDIVARVAHA